jgi:hypothetical protein
MANALQEAFAKKHFLFYKLYFSKTIQNILLMLGLFSREVIFHRLVWVNSIHASL